MDKMKIGAFVIKNGQGICEIQDIVTKFDVNDKEKQYYLLKPIEDRNATIYVAVDNINKSCRAIVSETDAAALIHHIDSVEPIKIENEKEREKIYKQTLREGNLEKVAAIIVKIYIRNQARQKAGKKNTAIDERYFRLAEHSLFSELAFALHKSEEEVRDMVRERFVA